MRKPASFIIRSVPNGYTNPQRKVFRVHEAVFSSRLTVAGCTLKRRAVSAAVFRPEEIISMTSVGPYRRERHETGEVQCVDEQLANVGVDMARQ